MKRMKNTIAVTRAHTLTHWSHAGAPVIYPLKNTSETESRGGVPLCVPMFSAQQRPVPECELPLHGLLMYSNHGEINHNAESDTITVTSHFSATEQFNWNHTVVTAITETANSLSYHVTISRAPDCPNQNQMPLSLAFHPYFATHGQDFSFTIGERHWTRNTLPDNIIDSAFAHYTPGETVRIQTAAHTVAMTASGFDEYCLWTDDVSQYICIEPIWQYREFGLPGTGLQPGDEKVVTMDLRVEQVNQ